MTIVPQVAVHSGDSNCALASTPRCRTGRAEALMTATLPLHPLATSAAGSRDFIDNLVVVELDTVYR